MNILGAVLLFMFAIMLIENHHPVWGIVTFLVAFFVILS